ncbi:MAG: hypothetical protein J7K26_03655 [Candidatus Aenigmarchaeota archaeon]|nr:hypothetical protein [Candidatus Aenigmarchaeota archaeon]
MSFLDIFKKLIPKKKEIIEEPFPEPIKETSLPPELEQFKTTPPLSEPKHEEPFSLEQKIDIEPYPKPPTIEEPKKPIEEKPSIDKIELILTKLDTIDTRLKLIEEKINK